MISVNEVADMLGISKQRVYVLESRGDIQAAWVSPGGRRYYSKEKIQEFYNQGYQTDKK
jgi:DNA-binding transcriptional MerR regulator